MKALDPVGLERLFIKAHTLHSWKREDVSDGVLIKLYELIKWAPTCVNGAPARFIFVKSKDAKEKLITSLLPKNVEKTRSAPVTVIIAEDLNWHSRLGKLMPHADYESHFRDSDELIKTTAFRNSSLQGGYLIMAARALGLDCGPMSGFDNSKLDSTFFAGTSLRSNFLCNIGYGDPAGIYPRSPRLSFDEACRLL